MNKDIKKRWLDALRSGKYKQGVGALRKRGYKFCCLGVLCDIVKPSSWTICRGTICYQMGNSTGLPPKEVLEVCGIVDDFFGFDGIGFRLTTMNDSENKTFNEIADFIEEKISDD